MDAEGKMYLWKCDDGTYDVCDEEGSVVVCNVPRAALYHINELYTALKQIAEHDHHAYDAGYAKDLARSIINKISLN